MFRQIQAEHADRSGSRRDHPQQHLNCGRLTGPVRPQETHDLPWPDLKRDAVHGGEVTKPLYQTLNFNNWKGHGTIW